MWVGLSSPNLRSVRLATKDGCRSVDKRIKSFQPELLYELWKCEETQTSDISFTTLPEWCRKITWYLILLHVWQFNEQHLYLPLHYIKWLLLELYCWLVLPGLERSNCVVGEAGLIKEDGVVNELAGLVNKGRSDLPLRGAFKRKWTWVSLTTYHAIKTYPALN
jgi:hypothetical protein